MKKPVQKLRIHRETIVQLDRTVLENAAGGITTSKLCTLGSCGHICP